MKNTAPYFRCIPLGVEGGLIESNLPAYLLAPIGSTDFVCLDAGTLLGGLRAARANSCFSDIAVPLESADSVEGRVLLHHIKAYLITHTYIESSHSDEMPDDQLRSHLTPKWVMHAFRQLAGMVDPRRPGTALAGLTVVITHIKPHLGTGEETRAVVERQLHEQNDLRLRLVFAEQARPFEL